MRSVIAFTVVALVVAGIVPRYYARVQHDAEAAAKAAPAPQTASPSSMTIRRGDNGHYSVAGSIDGRRMDFLIDTGASSIALRESDAARLGIHPTARDYTGVVSTANGMIRVAPVELNRVEVGPITVYNVQAVVLPDRLIGQNLLGMSFLSRVHMDQQNGRLVLEQ